MSIRVKMRVTGIKHCTVPREVATEVTAEDGSVERTVTGHAMFKTAEEVTLGVVFEGAANKRWAELAPNGHMSLTLTHPEMFNVLVQDAYLFVDLTPTGRDD